MDTHVSCKALLSIALIAMGSLLAAHAQGATYEIPTSAFPPERFEDVEQVLREIDGVLSGAQCGGWSTSEQVGLSVGRKIPLVTGAPGRSGEPLGNKRSGMAKRDEVGGALDDGFQFPENAWGKTTVCEPGRGPTEARPIYCDGDRPGTRNCMTDADYPSFEDPYACLYNSVERLQSRTPSEPPNTEPVCQEFCDALNDPVWQYDDCKFYQGTCRREADGSIDPNTCSWSCEGWRAKWTCSEDWVTHNEPDIAGLGCGQCPLDGDGNPTACDVTCHARETDAGEDAGQCKGESGAPGCEGDECRCPGPGCTFANGHPFQSFFRHYDVTTTREQIDDVPSDVLDETEAEVHCYGFYAEFDPKLRATVTGDQRCIIGNFFGSDEEEIDPENLRSTQQGKGDFRPDPLPQDALPPERNPDFDIDTDLWYVNLGGSLSFLNERVFSRSYDNKLSKALENPDKAVVHASVQNTEAEPWARGGALRAIDDTVSNGKFALVENKGLSPGRGEARPFTQWFQQFTTTASRLFSPPVVRLILPATWTFSLQPLHPQSIARDPRTQSITVQTHADDDLLGNVTEYLQQSLLLTLREEPVYAVVPLGSPVEFGAMALQWREWKELRARQQLPIPPETDAIIAKLEAYELQIEQVRLLRSELPKYIGTLLQKQANILLGISQWQRENLENYRTYLAIAQARRALQEDWKTAAAEMLRFSDDINLPWCRNDRFTLPIYSLLDPWYPARPDLSGGIPTCDADVTALGASLPRICLPPQPDLVLDLSRLVVTPGDVTVPVLKPVTVRIDIPAPPTESQRNVDLSKMLLPNLPPLPTINTSILDELPTPLGVSRPLTLQPARGEDLTQAGRAIAAAREIILGMQRSYEAFWESIRPSDRTRNLECYGYGEDECVHVEMDLLERFMRLAARPGVLLQEDLEVWGVPRMPIPPDQLPSNEPLPPTADWLKDSTCNPQDYACQHPNSEWQYPQDGWQIVPQRNPPGVVQKLEDLRTNVRQTTIDDDGKMTNDQQYVVPDIRLYPTFTVPPSIDLRNSSPTP